MFTTVRVNTDNCTALNPDARWNDEDTAILNTPETLHIGTIGELVGLLMQAGGSTTEILGFDAIMFELVQQGWTIGWVFGLDHTQPACTIMIDCSQTETATDMMLSQAIATEATAMVQSILWNSANEASTRAVQQISLDSDLDAELLKLISE